MDQSKLSDLDPKLREAYERVMGTALAHNAAPATSTPQQDTQTQAAQVVANLPTEKFTGATKDATQNFMPSLIPMTDQPHKPRVSLAILVALGVVFFAVYTIFWVKLFNLSIPFIN